MYHLSTEMFSERRKLGNLGEDLAVKFLMKQGFSLVSRNFLRKCGEIDIVCKKGNTFHFIEVKTVSCEIDKSYRGQEVTHVTNNDAFRPEDNVHPAKLKRLANTVQLYLMENNVSDSPCGDAGMSRNKADETDWQIDLVCVYLDIKKKEARVKMLENVV